MGNAIWESEGQHRTEVSPLGDSFMLSGQCETHFFFFFPPGIREFNFVEETSLE